MIFTQYPEWVAKIVPIPKKDRRIRLCVDFHNLNKVSPKDNFSLPYINVLVDGTLGYELLSLIDGLIGYNQILVALKDREKTTFITHWGTYFYRVMPFVLKNVGDTYQRAATTLLNHYNNNVLWRQT